ncbi:hypothetical protein GCM10017788_64110 [Amycolatopsis acidiphila]|nr:hypothetical protein GCM10017788_64110 [Amycolatopsis acidiphila]
MARHRHGLLLGDETVAMMAARGAWLVPTLSAGVRLRQAIESDARLVVTDGDQLDVRDLGSEFSPGTRTAAPCMSPARTGRRGSR